VKKTDRVEADGFDKYLSETRGLERDYLAELVTSRRRAWRVAMGFGTLSAMSVVGMLGVVVSHRNPPPPPVFTIDRSTGHVDMVTTLANDEIEPGWAVAKQYINTYVLNREGYDYNSLQLFYNTTGLMSSERVQAEYGKLWQGDDALDKKLGDTATISVDIKSIVEGPDQTATVRFSTTTRHNNGMVTGPVNYIATLAYRYVGAPMKEDDRRIDALGFQVTSYRVDPESVQPAPAAPVAPAAPATIPGTAVAPAAPATAESVTVPALAAPAAAPQRQ